MFYSLVQTLFCVLLIQGGLYALHLTGSPSSGGGGNSDNAMTNSHLMQVLNHQSSGAGSSASGLMHRPQNSAQHGMLKAPSSAQQQQQQAQLQLNSADMAALERERIMIQAAANAAAAAAATGHHGRPIITGRVQMTPAEMAGSGEPGVDYAIMQQPQIPRNYLFGSVVKQPPRQHDDYDTTEEFDGGGRFAARRRPTKYEYGRVVQPSEREFDPSNMDLEGFMELEVPEPEIDDFIPDLDGYQYLDDLLAEQNNKAWLEEIAQHEQQQQHYPQNPYQVLEDELEVSPPQALQELFEKERERERERERLQHDAPHMATQQHTTHKEMVPRTRNAAGSGYNIRLQQKWQRKRNQQPAKQQLPLQRNIFGGHQKHHYLNSLQHAKFSLANSEATATKHIGNKFPQTVGSTSNTKGDGNGDDTDDTAGAAGAAVIRKNLQSNSNQADNSNKQQQQATSNAAPSSSSPASATSSASGAGNSNNNGNINKNLRGDTSTSAKEHLLQSNQKRSGAMSGGMGYSGAGGLQPPPISHSIASQLMLRTARGQRQYDVPQIECPTAMDGMERFACPTPDLQGRYRCIDDHVLCDGFIDCPEGEDEDRRSCMFYKTTKAHLDVLADALLRWARGR